MTVRIPARALALAALLAAGSLLTACGKMGDLQRPGPLNGQGRSTTKAADEATRQAQDPSRPVDTVDPRDRATDPSPPRTLPIPGGPSDPSKTAQPGAIPDPYANPR